MHAVIVTDFAAGIGGAVRVAVESARGLAEAGVQVTYIHATEGADERLEHHSIKRICLGLADVWMLPSAQAAKAGVWNDLAAARLASALESLIVEHETVIHVHQWTRALSPSIFGLLRKVDVPVFLTNHDYFISCPNGVLFRFDLGEPCRLSPMSARCLSTNCDTRSFLHKCVRSLRVAAARLQLRDAPLNLVHVSDRGREMLAPSVSPSWRHHRLDNPVPIEKKPPIHIAPRASFAFIGRLTEEKGAILAAAAARRAEAPIIFIGDGPAAAEVRTLCPSAEITGWLSPRDVANLLRTRVRAVLAPSLWPETGPLTVYEAAAIGLPVIVSERCGASEKVSCDSGFVAEPTPDAFAAAFSRLRDDETARSMGRAAYDRYWADPPTPSAHAHKLIKLYEHALSSKTR